MGRFEPEFYSFDNICMDAGSGVRRIVVVKRPSPGRHHGTIVRRKGELICKAAEGFCGLFSGSCGGWGLDGVNGEQGLRGYGTAGRRDQGLRD